MPLVATEDKVLLGTSADVRRVGYSCDDIYFMAVNTDQFAKCRADHFADQFAKCCADECSDGFAY